MKKARKRNDWCFIIDSVYVIHFKLKRGFWYFTFNNKKYYPYVLARVNIEQPEVYEEIRITGLDKKDAISRAKNFYQKHWKDEFKYVGEGQIKARDIWKTIWENAVESGDPGVYNIDLANSFTNVSYFESLDSTNPCGEISLPRSKK